MCYHGFLTEVEPLKGEDTGTQKSCALVIGAGGKEPVWGEGQKVPVTLCLELVQEEVGKGVKAESHYKLRGINEVLAAFLGW